MKTKIHEAKQAEQAIYNLRDFLFRLLHICNDAEKQMKEVEEKLLAYDKNNDYFYNLLGSVLERMKMFLLCLALFICMGIDYFVSFQALSILGENMGLPDMLRYVVPVALVLYEIIVSYFQILHKKTHQPNKLIFGFLQYAVLLILAALVVLVVKSTFDNYDPTINHESVLSYLIGTLVYETICLVASFLLHIWLVRNSEKIAEASAFWGYVYNRGKLLSSIKRLKRFHYKKYDLEFTSGALEFVQDMENYNRNYPDFKIDFMKVIPVELILAIEKVMGRKLFGPDENPKPWGLN